MLDYLLFMTLTQDIQAIDFLSNHASTIAILLKVEADYVTLSMLEEIHLLVTMSGMLLTAVPKTELVSTGARCWERAN